jgi:hypothetical protein
MSATVVASGSNAHAGGIALLPFKQKTSGAPLACMVCFSCLNVYNRRGMKCLIGVAGISSPSLKEKSFPVVLHRR